MKQLDIVIFIDMDGILFDYYMYSFVVVVFILDKLKMQGMFVILNISKMFLEMVELCEKIGLKGLFIIENGVVVFIFYGFFE